MPRRSVLSAAERVALLSIPDNDGEWVRQYTFSEVDQSLIDQRRGEANRLGIAVQLCLLRWPGQGLPADAGVPDPLLRWLAHQLGVDPGCWPLYAEREATRREHLLELRAYLGLESFGLQHYRPAVQVATELALQTDKGIVLANRVVEVLRQRRIILPSVEVIERLCAEAITRANRQIYASLTDPLTALHRQRLDDLLKRHCQLAEARSRDDHRRRVDQHQTAVTPNVRAPLARPQAAKAWLRAARLAAASRL